MPLYANQVSDHTEAEEASGDVQLGLGGSVVRAESLRLNLGAGQIEAYNLEWSPCSCEPLPWGVSAESVEGTFSGEFQLRGVWLEVCERKVFPLPGGLWSFGKREPRPMMPTFAFSDRGMQFGAPMWIPIGARASAELAPQMRTDGAPGLTGSISSSSLSARSELIVEDDTNRGRLAVIGADRTPTVNWGVDADWVSDARYRPQYGKTFFDRQSIAAATRAHVGSGPGRVEYFAPLHGGGARTVSGGVYVPAETFFSGSLASSMRVSQRSVDGHVVESIGARAAYVKGVETDFFRVVGKLNALETLDSTGALLGEYGTSVSVGLLHWSDMARNRLISVSGMASGLEYGRGSDELERALFAGPFHETRVVGNTGIPMRARLFVPLGPAGWEPEGEVEWLTGGVQGLARGNLREQSAALGAVNDALRADVGVIRDEHLTAAYGAAGVSFYSKWNLNWSGAIDLDSMELVRHGPELSWGPHCDCVSATASVEWARDIDLPTAFVRVDLRPEG